MAIADVIRFPGARALDPLDPDLQEVLAAIGLVAGGATKWVSISGLCRPQAIAGVAVAHAQEAGVRFVLEPNETGGYTVMVRRLPD
ncbi:MAG: hypothetical protein ACXWWR_00400 [Candidatus Limnocylindrales bacterium]